MKDDQKSNNEEVTSTVSDEGDSGISVWMELGAVLTRNMPPDVQVELLAKLEKMLRHEDSPGQ
jgi:hypothetical protein